MVKLAAVLISFVVFQVHGDLIGYNRLGNNIDTHTRGRVHKLINNYSDQVQWVLNSDSMTLFEKQEWIKLILQGKPRRQTESNRLHLYKRAMVRRFAH